MLTEKRRRTAGHRRCERHFDRRAQCPNATDCRVIGVDNDEPLCDLSIPPMTSVDVNSEGVGYEAAALLDRLMDGRKPPAKGTKVAPRGVITRLSTDMVASEDEEVNRAVRYIRENACKGLQVVDVVNYMGMSRATFVRRSTGRADLSRQIAPAPPRPDPFDRPPAITAATI